MTHVMVVGAYGRTRVRVCDICGVAGYKALLAICCRCGEGGEHIYCMRELLETVLEGDWMCDECQYDEEMKNQMQRKVVNVDGNVGTSSGKLSGGNSNARLKSDTRSRNELVIISKDRLLDKGKEKLAHQSSSSAPVGSFLKSTSLSSFKAKPKVIFIGEAVPLKQKSVREPPRVYIKKRIGKSYGKSVSFRSMVSGRHGNGKSKVKMLSEKLPHNQVDKGFRHTEERSVIEKKSSLESKRPVVSSPMARSSIPNSKNMKKLGSTVGQGHFSLTVKQYPVFLPGGL
ncbi:hypothetical protein LIER_32472 [Lithospermum erythrorhizon]|uniref:Zinc finger PHD-type domain-containing protein n=1 Tax=Lithospermum erythrorhizon TaxID=34254 RepID=A0AAV3RUW6_LITER